eukprot:15355496-Ditylum_brightwellii.AAC.1
MEACLLQHLQRLPGFGLRQLAISIGFDGKKVPQTLTLNTNTRTVMGGHNIDVSNMSEKDLKDLLCGKWTNVVMAKAIKCAVVSIHNVGKGHTLLFLLAAQPQSIKAVSTFNKQVTSVCLDNCHRERSICLISVAADGVGCDARFI